MIIWFDVLVFVTDNNAYKRVRASGQNHRVQFRPTAAADACLVDVLRFDDYSVSRAWIGKAARLFLPKVKDVRRLRIYRHSRKAVSSKMRHVGANIAMPVNINSVRALTRIKFARVKKNRVSLRDYRDTRNRRKRIAVSSVKFGVSRQAVADVGQSVCNARPADAASTLFYLFLSIFFYNELTCYEVDWITP